MPVNVSPLIRGGRWAALLIGITYGHQHNKTVTELRKADEALHAIHMKEAAAAAEARKLEEANAPSILQ